MNITDYCDAINATIRINYYPNQRKRFCARIEGAEVKEKGCLASVHGNGITPLAAIADYAKQIAGKVIVFDAFDGEKRRELQVPINLSIEEFS